MALIVEGSPCTLDLLGAALDVDNDGFPKTLDLEIPCEPG
jgi:hypothetical protein